MSSGRPRSAILWLQLLVVASLAVVVIVLGEAYRAARSTQAVSERALADYANFAAWSFREHALTRIREAVDELLGPVNHGEGLHTGAGIPDVSALGHYIRWNEACKCHRPWHGPSPVRYVGFTLGSDTLGVGSNYAPDSVGGWLADPPAGTKRTVAVMVYSRDERLWINRLLTQVARRQPRSNWGYDFMVTRYENATRVFSSRSMPTTGGDTAVYAVEYSAAALDGLLSAVLNSSDLLPSSLVRSRVNRDVIDLEVSDSSGVALYHSRQAPRWDLAAVTMFPPSYGGLRVRAQLRPELARSLLIGGVPRSRVPLVLAILAMGVGLAVLAAVQLRREVRFAGERAGFVASVSHELRTPLAQVRLVLDTLRLGRGGDAPSRSRALDVANREVLRLQHLVEGVLRFSRGARHDGPRSRSDVAREVRAVVAEFEPLAAARHVQVVVTGADAVEATLHTGALRQVLLNLLDNAVKYGGENAAVTVDVGPLVATAGRRAGVRLTVTDTGPGVPASERERIWRPFERGSTARTRAAGGSGIGLTIVREIAGEHGGTAVIENGVAGGARFVVDLHDLPA
ncbi:MAG: sensor histidine kinase [Gemmatimonadales bacterium]